MPFPLLTDLLDGTARDEPDSPALHADGRTWTFEHLREQTVALAAALGARTPAGARVAILAHNRAEYVVAYYGVPRAARVLVPLNPRLHPREWADQLRRAGVSLLVGEDGLLDDLRRVEPAAVPGTVRFGDEWDALLDAGRGDPRLPAPGGPGDTAWVLFTSGTTGRPKGVRLTHANLCAGVANSVHGRPVAWTDVFLTPFPLCHIAGYSVLLHHLHGRPVVLLRRFDAADLVAAVERYSVTSLSLAPTMIDALLDHLAAAGPAVADRLRAQLRTISYGASPIPTPLLRRTLDVLGADLNQGFGMTELAGNAAFLDAAAHRAAVTDRPDWLVAAGRPGRLAHIRVVDDAWRERPVGEVGEVVVKGPQVTVGYWDDPAGTAQAITDGWLRTGDLGRLDADGMLYLVDRKKDVIVTGGENVSSREVEDVLRAHPGVREVAVVGRPDARWGEVVCAVVVPAVDPPPDPAELIAACRERLAGFKAPRQVRYVDALPRTSTGKVRKDLLRDELAAATE